MLITHYINGKAYEANEDIIPVYSPSTDHVIAQCPIAGSNTVELAVAAAHQAFETWSTTPVLKRTAIFQRFCQLLEAHQDELAQIISEEHGKLLADARGSLARALECAQYTLSAPSLLHGTMSSSVATQIDCASFRQPLGVAVGISPFNFPVMVPVWMFSWAMILGNTFILKPSEQAPSVTNRLAQLLQEAGLPDGVFNIVHGNASTVEALITHPHVSAVSAVASTPVAKSIYHTAIAHGKRAQTFGGAKNHALVMPDAMNPQTADAIIAGAFGSSGERCMATSVLLLPQHDATNDFVLLLKSKIAQLTLGHSLSDDADMGPLISAKHKMHVLDAIAQGIKEGAQLIEDGSARQVPGFEKGYFVGPCLFDHVTTHMQLYQQEIFGPVLAIVRVKDMNEAIMLINKNPYGNAAAIFTQNGSDARQFSQDATVGMVGINIATPVPVAHHPFGGWKQSFFGDIGMHGDESVRFYTRSKSVTSRWQEDVATLPRDLSMPNHS